MAILSIQIGETGLEGISPRVIYIDTNDTLSTVTAAGYLNKAVAQNFDFSESDMALVTTQASSTAAKEVAWLEVSLSGGNWSLVPANSPGEVVLPTVANRLAYFTNTTGTITSAAGDATQDGNLNLGTNGNRGYLNLFAATTNTGSLRIQSANNLGNYINIITNAPTNQATQFAFPDPGVAGTTVLLTDNATVQDITTGDLQVSAGELISGADGSAGTLRAYSGTASAGQMVINCPLTTAFNAVVQPIATLGQTTTYSIPDPSAAAAAFQVTTSSTNPDPGANLIGFDVTVGQAALAAGGSVTLQASSGSKQYKIRRLFLNSGGTNFGGGGGDRLATISDGTTDYSVIPAATLQTLVNAAWGATALPFPGSAAINTSTVAGAALTIAYSGGTTDYTSGSMVISGLLERVA
jgi:hypothetical protein